MKGRAAFVDRLCGNTVCGVPSGRDYRDLIKLTQAFSTHKVQYEDHRLA